MEKEMEKYCASYCAPYYLQSVDPILKSEIKDDKHCESRSTIFICAKKPESNHFIHSKCQYSIKILTRQLKSRCLSYGLSMLVKYFQTIGSLPCLLMHCFLYI